MTVKSALALFPAGAEVTWDRDLEPTIFGHVVISVGFRGFTSQLCLDVSHSWAGNRDRVCEMRYLVDIHSQLAALPSFVADTAEIRRGTVSNWTIRAPESDVRRKFKEGDRIAYVLLRSRLAVSQVTSLIVRHSNQKATK